MKKLQKLLSYTIALLGFASLLAFIASYFTLEMLRPKMICFETITKAEESLINYFGINLLFFFAFCLLFLFKLAGYLKKAKKISLFSLFLLAITILSLLFIFGDIALINDIGKQYKAGLSQPEWAILYLLMAFQFSSALILTYANLFKLRKGQLKYVARDSNIFTTVQYVGLICGSIGLTSASLGFFFPRAWNLHTHVTLSSIILLTPYVLAVVYWFISKLQEKPRQWYDEKQLQDVGKSAFLTLVLSLVSMIGLFIANYHNLGGVVSMIWLPLYLFLVLFLFSAGNLYYSKGK